MFTRPPRLTLQRVQLEGWTVGDAVEAAGLSERTAHKGLRRYQEEGHLGLLDRSSQPRRIAQVHRDVKKLGPIKGIGHRITGVRTHRNRGIGT